MKKTALLLAGLLAGTASFGLPIQKDTAKHHHKKKHANTRRKATPGAALDPAKRNTQDSPGSTDKTGKGHGNGNGGTPAPPATPSHPPQ